MILQTLQTSMILLNNSKLKAGIPKTYNQEVENSLSYIVQYGNMRNLNYFTDGLKKMIANGSLSGQYTAGDQLTRPGCN